MSAGLAPLPRLLKVVNLGLQPYTDTWQSMQAYTGRRDDRSADQIWLVEHPPVFTQGQAGKAEHVLDPGPIPVIQTDRGGQVTYHAPGQLVAYILLDLKRLGLGVRDLVTCLERATIDVLRDWGIAGMTRADAPGVFVGDQKIASLGLRVRRGCSFHGLSLNVAMDLQPFQRIHPCGYNGLQMTQMADLLATTPKVDAVAAALTRHLSLHLKITAVPAAPNRECYE